MFLLVHGRVKKTRTRPWTGTGQVRLRARTCTGSARCRRLPEVELAHEPELVRGLIPRAVRRRTTGLRGAGDGGSDCPLGAPWRGPLLFFTATPLQITPRSPKTPTAPWSSTRCAVWCVACPSAQVARSRQRGERELAARAEWETEQAEQQKSARSEALESARRSGSTRTRRALSACALGEFTAAFAARGDRSAVVSRRRFVRRFTRTAPSLRRAPARVRITSAERGLGLAERRATRTAQGCLPPCGVAYVRYWDRPVLWWSVEVVVGCGDVGDHNSKLT